MNTKVQFDDKNRPTHDYLHKTSMNVVRGMDRNIPEDIPEYLGGSSVPVNIAPVAQTSASSISGSATPQGNLSAIGTHVVSPPFELSLCTPICAAAYAAPISASGT